MNVESDWCVRCGLPRPGFIDPAVKADKWKAEDAAEEVQGLPTDQQETCPEPGPKVRDVLASGEEAA